MISLNSHFSLAAKLRRICLKLFKLGNKANKNSVSSSELSLEEKDLAEFTQLFEFTADELDVRFSDPGAEFDKAFTRLFFSEGKDSGIFANLLPISLFNHAVWKDGALKFLAVNGLYCPKDDRFLFEATNEMYDILVSDKTKLNLPNESGSFVPVTADLSVLEGPDKAFSITVCDMEHNAQNLPILKPTDHEEDSEEWFSESDDEEVLISIE